MKKFTLLASLLMFVMLSYAANVVPVEDAMRASKNFLSERVGATKAGQFDLVLEHTEYSPDGVPVTYRFRVGDKGFIIVSATDLATPVLAYSLESNYKEGSGADVYNEQYTKELSYMISHPTTAVPVRNVWDHYLAADFKPYEVKGNPCVEPLVTTKWDQGKYFNFLTPYNPKCPYRDDAHTVVGCVALTMANILYYYRFPEQGYGASAYFPIPDSIGGDETYSYPKQVANYGASTFEYDAISGKKLTDYDGELAEILYKCGVSVRMSYGWEGSGTQSEYTSDALKDHFYFSETAQFEWYDDTVSYPGQHEQWVPKAKGELDAHRPIFYSGRTKTDGHAWIVDGYTTIGEETYFHTNWGWGGDGNGFFILTHQNSSSFGEFNIRNGMGIRYMPDSVKIVKPAESYKRVEASFGTISDGAGNMKYAKGSNRKWVLACPDAKTYELQFAKLKLQEGDYVTVYNGGTEASGIKERYTGNYLMPACSDYTNIEGCVHSDYTGTPLPGAFSVTADSVLVVFTSTENSETDFGFVLEYEVTAFNQAENTCANKTVTDQCGFITEKGFNEESDAPYRLSQTCEYTLKLFWTDRLVYAFPEFNLNEGDFVDIYNIPTRMGDYELLTFDEDKKIVAHYDIYNMPNGTYAFDAPLFKPMGSQDFTSQFVIRFVSDNMYQGDGFKLEYYGIQTSINGYNNVDVTVYPNPATNYLNVNISSEDAQQFKAEVVDMTGKVVYVDQFNHNGGTEYYQIPVNNFAKGVYFLHLDNQNGRNIQKFIVR